MEQLPEVERPGPVGMVHAKGGYLPRLLRPGPLSLDGGLYPSAGLFRASQLARLSRGGAAGLTRVNQGQRLDHNLTQPHKYLTVTKPNAGDGPASQAIYCDQHNLSSYTMIVLHLLPLNPFYSRNFFLNCMAAPVP